MTSADSGLTVAERAARGKAARTAAPRAGHSAFEPAADRPDPIELLERQAATRVSELVPVRYGRMLASPFAFYRGAAIVMAHDLARTASSGVTAQCCGDAHLSNFGVFASPERRLIFDINDFDETLPGPWEWDVKRLSASMLIAARDNGYRVKQQHRIVLDTIASYRNAMRDFAKMPNLAVWYARLEVESLLATYARELQPKVLRRTQRGLAKARARDSLSSFAKLTQRSADGEVRIVDRSPLIVPLDVLLGSEDERADLLETLRRLLGAYRHSLEVDRRTLLDQFQPADYARKVVGVGSVGTQAWIALLLGRDGQDPLFLQVKEAEASVFEEILGSSQDVNHGRRVVSGQRLMQASSDIFLGWLRDDGAIDGKTRHFYVRQLKDWKGSVEIDQLKPEGMSVYGKLCGWTLARAHARSSDRIAIAAYLGKGDGFDRAIREFSIAYADQNERDYGRLADAARSGRLAVETGV